MVEISRIVDGPVVNSYAVQDKTQQADVDAQMLVEDELFAIETFDPCLICGVADDGHGTMYCDGCDQPVHVFCAGMDDAPDVWYCETCMADLQNDQDLSQRASAPQRRRHRQTNAPSGGRRRRNNDAIWARVWQEVSRRLDLDLDFPFDEDQVDQRTEEQRREFERWQRRFEVANRQGTANRLRGVAAARLNQTPLAPAADSAPESQEELRAWNAFDKARESQDAPIAVRRHKRRATDSPQSPRETDGMDQPQLKRPRLRRPTERAEQPESSTSAVRRHAEEPTFLSSLLREVENKPVTAASPVTSDFLNGHISPRHSSPAWSPDSSECGTPPPQRPQSPPLSSSIMPMISPVGLTFSPFSPIDFDRDPDMQTQQYRGRRRRTHDAHDSPADAEGRAASRAGSSSPSRLLSYSAKEEIQRMVKLALGSRYREKSITKDQYTVINRDVSRKMYELVQDASALSDQEEREKWQNIANEEVCKAVAALLVTGAPSN